MKKNRELPHNEIHRPKEIFDCKSENKAKAFSLDWDSDAEALERADGNINEFPGYAYILIGATLWGVSSVVGKSLSNRSMV
jgi:hypothetical protein